MYNVPVIIKTAHACLLAKSYDCNSESYLYLRNTSPIPRFVIILVPCSEPWIGWPGYGKLARPCCFYFVTRMIELSCGVVYIGSDSDEARFRRRKARSMAKGRSQCLPMNFAPEDISHGAVRDRVRIGASLADIDPMNIDRDVTFDSVGGLQHHIRALKEMIIFPLLYPEVFERFKINPPRGVLFYGPPGCGKTLVARALANECSKGGKKVAFFMRKGADCLSKWVGESERQLRLLFDQVSTCTSLV